MPYHRDIFNEESERVHKADISTDLQCMLCIKSPCHPSSCLCFPTVSSKAADSSYLHVYTNRIEYNYPLTTVTWDCSCQVVDDVRTIYFDRIQMEEVYSLEGCICGYDKTVVVRRPCASCADVNTDSCCCGRVYFPCVEDAQMVVRAIQDQKAKRCAAPGGIPTMER